MSAHTDRSESQPGQERPSKSARKRAAHEAQDLGETLIGLRESELAALDLPETLVDAIRLARTITSRGGGARQRQYIGKLMRELDIEPIRAALGARSERSLRDAERFKRVEEWRERLIRGGAQEIEALEGERPGLDRELWTRLVSAAQQERARTAATGAHGRELFRTLRGLLENEPPA